MECFANIGVREPYLYSSDGIITKVNNEFINFTGFRRDELVGKSLIEVGDMIKVNSQLNLDNMQGKYSGFIFTKFMEIREVNIVLFHDKNTNEKMYTFAEKLKSRFEDKSIFSEQIFTGNIWSAAVYSAPDLILLKANQGYLDFMAPPFNKYENIIGRHIEEIIKGYIGSEVEAILKTVCEAKKAVYIKELKFDDGNSSTRYWDVTAIPIFEDGEMKYIVATSVEVTERVLKNQSIERQKKIIEKQKEQLEQKNTQLNSILENLSEGVILWDNEGKVIMVNEEAKRLLYQSDKVNDLGESQKNIKFFDMEGKQILSENMPGTRAFRGERVKNTKMFVSNVDKECFIDNSSIPIYNDNGNLTMVISCFHEITETIEKSKKIEEQKKELEAVIENITDSIFICDKEGEYRLCNKSARKMFSLDCEYLSKICDGNGQAEFYSIDGQKIDLKKFLNHRVMQGEKFKNMRLSIKFHDKTLQIDVSGIPIYDEKGEFSLGVFCCRDMTDYFKHEETIRGKYEFLAQIIDTFNLPVVRLACSDLKIVDINKKAFSVAKLFRPEIKSIKSIKGTRVEDLFNTFKTSEYYKCISEVLKEKKRKHLKGQKNLANGKEIYSNVIFEPMFEGTGELKEILILMIDVTPEIKSNIIMEKALESHEEFLANISHELKTPLNVIFATAQLINMYCNSDSLVEMKDSIIKYIGSIEQNSYRLSKLINNIVDLSKIKSGFFELNLSNNDIVEVVEEIVMSVTKFTQIKGLNIIFDTDTEEKIIACDPEKIERIVLNLISNAIKFSNKGDEIFVDINENNEFIEISVKDNGIGIEANDLAVIFDRFKQVDKSLTRNAEGTGIGLSLVKSFVELHGGSINVQSQFGEGSKFTVLLPSRKIVEESKLSSSKIRNKSEIIQLELSDICS